MTLLAGTLVQARREYLADRAVMMQRRADLLDEWEKADVRVSPNSEIQIVAAVAGG